MLFFSRFGTKKSLTFSCARNLAEYWRRTRTSWKRWLLFVMRPASLRSYGSHCGHWERKCHVYSAIAVTVYWTWGVHRDLSFCCRPKENALFWFLSFFYSLLSHFVLHLSCRLQCEIQTSGSWGLTWTRPRRKLRIIQTKYVWQTQQILACWSPGLWSTS